MNLRITCTQFINNRVRSAVAMNDTVRFEVEALPFVLNITQIRPSFKISTSIYSKLANEEYGAQVPVL